MFICVCVCVYWQKSLWDVQQHENVFTVASSMCVISSEYLISEDMFGNVGLFGRNLNFYSRGKNRSTVAEQAVNGMYIVIPYKVE